MYPVVDPCKSCAANAQCVETRPNNVRQCVCSNGFTGNGVQCNGKFNWIIATYLYDIATDE